MKTEFVTYRQWEGYARRLERTNLRNRSESLTAVGISRGAEDCIVEIQSDRGGILARAGWKAAMREKAAEELRDGKI